MRVWRRIIGDPRYRRTQYSDLEVRQVLGVDSIDCAVRKRRLMYIGRVVNADLPALHALLAARGPAGEPQEWLKLIMRDLAILRQHLYSKLGELPNPQEHLEPWWEFMRSHPSEWKSIVRLYSSARDGPPDKKTVMHEGSHAQLAVFQCVSCNMCFESHRQLSTHQWGAHGIKSHFRK